MPELIGLGGLKESGKDTFAEGLLDNWRIIGMSDPLLKSLLTLNPYVADNMRFLELYEKHNEDYVYLKANYPEVRRLLLVMGTEVGRDLLSEDVWVNKAKERIAQLHSEGLSVAITGIRFPNELKMIRELNGKLLWVKRASQTVDKSKFADAHSSENSVSEEDFDETILNDSTVEELKRKAFDFSLLSNETIKENTLKRVSSFTTDFVEVPGLP